MKLLEYIFITSKLAKFMNKKLDKKIEDRYNKIRL